MASGDIFGGLGYLLGSVTSAAGAYFTNKQAQKLQEKQWAQSIELANTAHQREVLDLRNAGLNPILSASGSGSSVPTLGSASLLNPGEGLADGISSASKLMSDQYRAQVDNLKANTDKANADTSAVKVHSDLVYQQRENEQIRGHILEQERGAGLEKAFNTKLQNAAMSEAITGRRQSVIDDALDWDDRKAVKSYNDLVQKYRNQIELERYMNSKERQMILDGVNTAGSLKSLKSSKTVIHNHHLKGKK